MPILVNNESGLAENFETPDEATAAAQAGTHSYPVVNPQGETELAPASDAAETLAQPGYRQPTQPELHRMMLKTATSGAGQSLKAAAEGALSGFISPVGAAAEQKMLGINPEMAAARAENHPVAHMAGEGAALVGGALSGTGEGALLDSIGTAAASGIGEATAGARIGSAALKGSVENMLYTAPDEVSKMMSGQSDPADAAESFLIHEGTSGILGGLIGGGLKGTGELWNLGPGKKVTQVLDGVKNGSTGLDASMGAAAGVEVPPSVGALIGDDPKLRDVAQKIYQASDSAAGKEALADAAKVKSGLSDSILNTLGKTQEDLENVKDLSTAEHGAAQKEAIKEQLEPRLAAVEKEYKDIGSKFEEMPLQATERQQVADSLTKTADELGVLKNPDGAAFKAYQTALKNLPLQENMNDLKLFINNTADKADFTGIKPGEGAHDISAMAKAMDMTNKDILGARIAQNAPDLVPRWEAANKEYSSLYDLKNQLQSRLGVKQGGGSPRKFLNNLMDDSITTDEKVAKGIGKVHGDSAFQQFLGEQFPKSAQISKDYEVNKLLKSATKNADGTLNPGKFVDKLNKESPELRRYLMSEQQEGKIGAIKELSDKLDTSLKGSAKASFMDGIKRDVGNGALSSAGAFLGGIPGFVAGKLAGLVVKEAPAAIRLAYLKFLSSGAETSASGFKAAATFISAVAKGEEKLSGAVNDIFKGGSKVIEFPSSAARMQLSKHVDLISAQPQKLLADNDTNNDKTGHYLPNHAAALASVGARNAQYLASLRPQVAPLGPLDKPQVPSKTAEAIYNNALNIAENPLIIAAKIKNGSLTQADMVHLSNLAPAVMQRMQNKIVEQMSDSDNHNIPYTTKLSLGLFMQQPLDVSMQPQAIQAAQPIAPQAQGPAKGGEAHSMKALAKMPDQYQLPSQSREAHRASGH